VTGCTRRYAGEQEITATPTTMLMMAVIYSIALASSGSSPGWMLNTGTGVQAREPRSASPVIRQEHELSWRTDQYGYREQQGRSSTSSQAGCQPGKTSVD